MHELSKDGLRNLVCMLIALKIPLLTQKKRKCTNDLLGQNKRYMLQGHGLVKIEKLFLENLNSTSMDW